jgi:AcrR family transcriptional regulator
MAYPAGHRAAVKKNIINSARKLFNRYGFESFSPSDHGRRGPDARRIL